MTCAICKQEGHDADHCPIRGTVMSKDAKRSPLVLIAIVGILLLTIGGAIAVYALGGFGGGPAQGPGTSGPANNRLIR